MQIDDWIRKCANICIIRHLFVRNRKIKNISSFIKKDHESCHNQHWAIDVIKYSQYSMNQKSFCWLTLFSN